MTLKNSQPKDHHEKMEHVQSIVPVDSYTTKPRDRHSNKCITSSPSYCSFYGGPFGSSSPQVY